MMTMLLLSGQAWAQGTCAIDPFKDLKAQISALQDPLCLPVMKFNYTLTPDCSYRLNTEIEIPNADDLDHFMTEKIINPKVNLASADKTKILKYSLTPSGAGTFNQLMRVKKKGISVEVNSVCRLTGGVFACRVDTNKSKFKGILPIFERNETTITCSQKSPGLKKCSFVTAGKAKSIPFVAGACDMAAPGAAETIESTYRLAHYITHGNTNNLTKANQAILAFRKKAKDNPGNGKKIVTVSGKVN